MLDAFQQHLLSTERASVGIVLSVLNEAVKKWRMDRLFKGSGAVSLRRRSDVVCALPSPRNGEGGTQLSNCQHDNLTMSCDKDLKGGRTPIKICSLSIGAVREVHFRRAIARQPIAKPTMLSSDRKAGGHGVGVFPGDI